LTAETRHILQLLAKVTAGVLSAIEVVLTLLIHLLDARVHRIAERVSGVGRRLLRPIERPGIGFGHPNRVAADGGAALVELPVTSGGGRRVAIAAPTVVALESCGALDRCRLLTTDDAHRFWLPADVNAKRGDQERHRSNVHREILSS
jgi:hypothetical protein